MPNSSSRTGISMADSTPPALKSIHSKRFGVSLDHHAPTSSQTTSADAAAQAT